MMNTPEAAPTAPASAIEVLSINRLTDCGNLKAFVSIRLDSIEINGLRIVQQPGQRAWVSMPQVEYDREGQKCYAPMMKIHDRGLKQAITEAVLLAWQKGESGNGNGQLFRGVLHR